MREAAENSAQCCEEPVRTSANSGSSLLTPAAQDLLPPPPCTFPRRCWAKLTNLAERRPGSTHSFKQGCWFTTHRQRRSARRPGLEQDHGRQPLRSLWLSPSSTSSVSLRSRRPTSRFLAGTSCYSCAVCMKQLNKSRTNNNLLGGACSDQLQTRAIIASREREWEQESSSRAAFDGWAASNQRLLLLANLNAGAVILYPMGEEARLFIRFGRRYTIFDDCCILIVSWRFRMGSAMKDAALQKAMLLRKRTRCYIGGCRRS